MARVQSRFRILSVLGGLFVSSAPGVLSLVLTHQNGTESRYVFVAGPCALDMRGYQE